MKKATFLLSKDPTTTHGGDLTLSRLLMDLARESASVDVLCLSYDESSTSQGIQRVQKPEVSLAKIAARSLRDRKSLVHTRFNVDAYVEALNGIDSDIFIADHSYMAEPYLRSRHHGSDAKLLVNTVISESLVWTATRGLIGKLDARRIWRDELRVGMAAHAIGTYDEDEAKTYREHGAQRVHWLDVTLPPAEKIDVGATGPRLVFLGDRTWPPNQEAFKLLLQWWPDIAKGIPGAELLVVGKRSEEKLQGELPAGMTDIGFADDLVATLGSCRALVAPILTGGGVRVKILDAVSRGLPLVGTSPAVGSLAPVFQLPTFDTKDGFVERCREFLLDASAAAAEGDRMYELNAARWNSGAPQSTVQRWLDA